MRVKKSKNTSSSNTSSLSGRTVIGLDIDQGAVRMVQLSGKGAGQAQVDKSAIVRLPANVVSGNEIVDFDQLVAHLQQCYNKLKTSCKRVNLALPAGAVTIDEGIRFNPNDGDISLQNLIEAEVSRIGALDEMNYDWQVLSQDGRSGEQSVLMVAAKTDDVNRYSDLLDEIGLTAINVDVDLFAIANAFSYADSIDSGEFAHERIALFDVGDVNTKALIMENGQILYKHEMNFGLEQLLQLIQRTYQVSESEALNMALSGRNRPADYQVSVMDNFNMQIAQEVQRTMQFFFATRNVGQSEVIKQIFISGSGCIPQSGLTESVYAQTGVMTQQIAPISFAISKIKDGAQFASDENSLTKAFGLALRGLV